MGRESSYDSASFSTMLSAVPLGLALMDTDMRFVWLNERLAEMNGVPVSGHLGRTTREIMPELANIVEPNFARSLAVGEAVVDVEIHGRAAASSGIWHYSASFYPYKIDGRVHGVNMAVQDMTQLKLLEKALRSSEMRFRTICERAPIMIDAFDQEGKCIFANREMERRLGWTAKEMMSGLDLLSRCYPDARQRAKVLESIRRADGKFREYSVRVKDGSKCFHMWADFRLPDQTQISVGYDVTDLRKLERDLREANKLLEKKVVERTADLNTALTNVDRLRARLEAENIYLREEFLQKSSFNQVVGKSQALKEVLSKARSVAKSPATVLLLGETGTGKELIALAIHDLSQLSKRPLVKVNCASLPPSLIESELFGHERGAFTGAHAAKQGRFELADGGTIFLDEIGELPLEMQSKLLRVLHAGEFERVGGTTTHIVKIRVIAATNRDLTEALAEGTFREDLYFRLNVFPITIPPLRQRREDIPLLAQHFVEKYSQKYGKKVVPINAGGLHVLTNYDWPGNVRELENVIERTIIISTSGDLRIDDSLLLPTTQRFWQSDLEKLQDVERAHIIRMLGEANWTIEGKRGAALRLGMNPGTLRARMRKLGIVRPK